MNCYTLELVGQNKVRNYKDAVFLTIITFLTVGYGDFFPTTNAGRYIMVITVIGGQLYSALVIGLVHSQLTLTSEESGLLNIIANHKKEKQKTVVAATIIYYLLKMAGAKNTMLHKGNIFWYKTRKVKNLKFELYVEVMKFKRLKSELNAYYQTRSYDQNMNIIKSTENKLAQLANEVITIFNFIKDAKMERSKNINSSYRKWQSKMHEYLDQEKNKKGGQFVLVPNRTKTSIVQDHKQLSPLIKDKNENQVSEEQQHKIKSSQTVMFNKNQNPSKLSVNITNKEDEFILKIPTDENRSTSSKRSKNSKQGSNRGGNNNYSREEQMANGLQLANNSSLVEVLDQKQMEKRISGLSEYSLKELQIKKKAQQSWNKITSKENIKSLSSGENYSPKSRLSSKSKSETLSKFKKSSSKVDQSSPHSQRSPKSINQRRHQSLRRQTEMFNNASKGQKKSLGFSKSQTMNMIQYSGQQNQNAYNRGLSFGNGVLNNGKNILQKLKQQKTQLHPTMNSIVEEQEESLSEDEDDDDEQNNFADDDQSMSDEDEEEEANEEDNEDEQDVKDENQEKFEEKKLSDSSEDEKEEEDQKGSSNQQRMQAAERIQLSNLKSMLTNKLQNNYEESSETTSYDKSSPHKDNSKSNKQRLSEAFDDFKMKQEINQSIENLKNIYQNQGILKQNINYQRRQLKKGSIFSMNYDEDLIDDLNAESPTYRRKESDGSSISALNEKRKKQMMIARTRNSSQPDEGSLFVSEENKSSSNKLTPSGGKQSSKEFDQVIVQSKQDANFLFPSDSVSTNANLLQKHSISNLVVPQQKQQMQQQQENELSLSPIYPFQRKSSMGTFQLQVRQTPLIEEDYEKLRKISVPNYPDFNQQYQNAQIISNTNSNNNNMIQAMSSLDLLELFDKVSLGSNMQKRQSLLNFQEQLNQLLLQNKDNNPDEINNVHPHLQVHKQASQPSLSEFKLCVEKENLKQDLEIEKEQISSLLTNIEKTEALMNKAFSEAKSKIQKLKSSINQPILQVNYQILELNSFQGNSIQKKEVKIIDTKKDDEQSNQK